MHIVYLWYRNKLHFVIVNKMKNLKNVLLALWQYKILQTEQLPNSKQVAFKTNP